MVNSRWSWGAAADSGPVFLRVWEDQVYRQDGHEFVSVWWGPEVGARQGARERGEHLALIHEGRPAFGVIGRSAAKEGTRKTVWFQQEYLLRLGGLSEEDGVTRAEVRERVPVTEVVAAVERSSGWGGTAGSSTVRPKPHAGGSIVSVAGGARVGQGWFRDGLLRAWDGRCAVTGLGVPEALRASHIVPWRLSSDAERMDLENGLLLAATLDALFDVGLISFDDDGALLVSGAVPAAEAEALGLMGGRLRRRPSPKMCGYLAQHRAELFDSGTK